MYPFQKFTVSVREFFLSVCVCVGDHLNTNFVKRRTNEMKLHENVPSTWTTLRSRSRYHRVWENRIPIQVFLDSSVLLVVVVLETLVLGLVLNLYFSFSSQVS